jgi:hypothetical protein
MPIILLTRCQSTIVDVEDFEWLSAFKWCALWNVHTRAFYAVRNQKVGVHPRMVYMHRAILGAKPEELVDHRNRNSLDNQRLNLRICTNSQNHANVRPTIRNKSGFKGVSWAAHTKKWQALIKVDGKTRYLGQYSTPEEAARVYDVAAKQYFGEFALLNG